MTVYFTADTHFGHSNIIKYCNRPFGDVTAMDDALLKGWNSSIQPTDTVYHLGDFSACKPSRSRQILDSLNGKIFLIKGNHDRSADSKLCRDRFEWIKDYHFTTFAGGVKIALFHYALRIWDRQRHGAWHLFGHSHGKLKAFESQLCLDVGVDCWNFKPISLETVKNEMIKRGWKS